jgi:hypothetical protein
VAASPQAMESLAKPSFADKYRIVTSRLQEMRSERESYDSHYRELQDFFLTRRGRWITDSTTARGQKRNQKMVDPTPRFAARTLGAGMHAGSTNPATPWMKLETPDPEMMEVPKVSRWIYKLENLVRSIFDRTNLYSVLPPIYSEAGTFGSAPMVMLQHPTRVIHFVPKTVGSYFLAKNADGVVDTMYCEYKMTTRQLVGEFGIDRVSAQVRGAYTRGMYNAYSDVLHVIEPNTTSEYGNRSAANMPFRSCYYETQAALQSNRPLRESGFEDNPIAAFLWETTEITDPYGSSCGMDALGCAKALQVQTKQKAKAVDKLVDPPMVGDPALKNQPSSLIPGDVTYAGFTANGSAPKFQPAYTIRPELQHLIADVQDLRQLVEVAMYTDLFFAITRADPRNASVPEIDARKEEQILALGPVLQNHKSFIQAAVDRTVNIIVRNSEPVWSGRMNFPVNKDAFIEPPPEELFGVNLKVELTGALAQAFKQISATKVERVASFVGNLAAAQASAGQPVTAFDKFDSDQSIDEYALAIGAPPTVVRSDDDVKAIRDQRDQAQQAQQMASMAAPLKDAAQAAKAASETKLGTGSALDAVTGPAGPS